MKEERKRTNDMTALTPTQYYALKRILALRELTAKNGIITKRTQNEILVKLSPDDLTVVADILANDPNLSHCSVEGK